MADDAKFPIKIRSDLEGSGLKDTKDQMDEVGKKSEEVSGKQVEGGKKVELSHRELRESIRAVANQFGGLADVGLWLSPVTAALAIVLVAVEAIKSAYEKMRQPIEDANAAMAAVDASKLKSAADSAKNVADDFGEIAVKESELQASFERGNSAMDARIKKYDDELAGVEKVAEAEEKAFEAKIKYAQTLGQISQAEAEAAVQQARLKLDSLKAGNSEARLANEIHERSVQLAEAQYRQNFGLDRSAIGQARENEIPLKQGADQARAAAEAAGKSGFYANEQYFKTGQDVAKKIQNLEELAKSKWKSSKIYSVYDAEHGEDAAESARAAEAEIAALKQGVKQHQDYVAGLERIANMAEEADNQAKQQIKNAKDLNDANAKLIIEAPQAIQALTDALARLHSVNQQVAQASAQGAQAHAGQGAATEATHDMELVRQLETQYRQHPDSVRLEKLLAAMRSLTNLQNGSHGHLGHIDSEIDQLQDEVSGLIHQQAHRAQTGG